MASKTVEMLYQSPLVRAAVAFAVVGLLVSWLVGGCTPARVEGNKLAYIGEDIEGKPVSFEGPGFRGKVLLVDIWGLWCPACLQSIPTMVALKREFGNEGFEVIGLEFAEGYSGSRDDYIEGLRVWAKNNGINYTIVQAGETPDVEKVLPALKSFQGFPTAILIGRDGTVRHVETGTWAGSMQELEGIIGPLLRERLP